METITEDKKNDITNKEIDYFNTEIIEKTVESLHNNINAHTELGSISFRQFLEYLAKNPRAIIRSIFQEFHDMIKHYVGEGFNEYPDDPNLFLQQRNTRLVRKQHLGNHNLVSASCVIKSHC